jgi:hypothetical protein
MAVFNRWNTAGLFAALIKIHAIATRLLILDHLEIVRRETKGFQDAISKLMELVFVAEIYIVRLATHLL